MQLHPSDVYGGMEPRLQAAVARHRSGERTVATAASSSDEIAVIALVADVDAWHDHSEVGSGVTLGEAEGGIVVTARVPIERVDVLRQAPEVLSMKAAQPLSRMLHATVPEIEADDASRPPGLEGPAGGEGVIVGIVDMGADVAHGNFRNADGSSRILALWDQSGPLSAASPVGYGRVHRKVDIDAALHTPDPYGVLGYGPAPDSPFEQGTHGTHVMDIAVGNGNGSGVPGVAPRADVVFVHPAVSDIRWTGSGVVTSAFGDSVQLLEGLHFIFDEAGDRPCVVNISLGTNGGPHDGTSLVERGIDALLDAPNRAVVIAASNAWADGIHAAGVVPPDGSFDLLWELPGNPGERELEVWYDGADEFLAELLAPDGASIGTVALGASAEVTGDDGRTLLFVSHRAQDPNNGDNVLGIFIAEDVAGPTWTVRLHGARVTAGGAFHAWIERYDPSQSSFRPPHDNSHTIGSIACGHKSVVVGSYDAHKPPRLPISYFSSEGPTRDGREKPEVSAPGHDVLAAHSRTGRGVTRKSGTSMAAPAVTGLIAIVLAEAAARGESLDAGRIRDIVIGSVRSTPPAAGAWDPRYGAGRVSVREALRLV